MSSSTMCSSCIHGSGDKKYSFAGKYLSYRFHKDGLGVYVHGQTVRVYVPYNRLEKPDLTAELDSRQRIIFVKLHIEHKTHVLATPGEA